MLSEAAIASERCRCFSLVDIGMNMTDKMFHGIYKGKKYHSPDIEAILSRCSTVGVHGLLLTGGNVKESKACIEFSGQFSSPSTLCFSSVGCHPTRCEEFLSSPEEYYSTLDALLTSHSVHMGGCVAAVGEVGLDFDRLEFCSREVQEKYFEQQLHLAVKHKLPLFFHDRNSAGRFLEIVEPFVPLLSSGVVHSFTGSEEELNQYLRLGFYIGVNGCSLKTEENLRVAKLIPLSRLLLETDAPWCEIKNTHASRKLLQEAFPNGCLSDQILSQFPRTKKEKFTAGSMVRGRCEPCCIVSVLEVVFALHRETVPSIEWLVDRIFQNTIALFPCFTPK